MVCHSCSSRRPPHHYHPLLHLMILAACFNYLNIVIVVAVVLIISWLLVDLCHIWSSPAPRHSSDIRTIFIFCDICSYSHTMLGLFVVGGDSWLPEIRILKFVSWEIFRFYWLLVLPSDMTSCQKVQVGCYLHAGVLSITVICLICFLIVQEMNSHVVMGTLCTPTRVLVKAASPWIHAWILTCDLQYPPSLPPPPLPPSPLPWLLTKPLESPAWFQALQTCSASPLSVTLSSGVVIWNWVSVNWGCVYN